MVGSVQDAEDIVQDIFLKWLTVDQSRVNNTKSYLFKSVNNACINHLKSYRNKMRDSLEAVNPMSFIEKPDVSYLDLERDISAALAVINKKLEPVEKAIFLLREVFNVDYEDLQVVVNKKKENCRQMFCRAKEKLAAETSKINFELGSSSQLVDSFKKACSFDEPLQLIEWLKFEINQHAILAK